MKTAEEWANKINEEVLPALMTPIPVSSVENMVKQIQLDAMKEGMRRAAKIVGTELYMDEPRTPYQIHKAILTAAEQLTDKDL